MRDRLDMRLSDDDKERIAYIMKHNQRKTATDAVRTALQVYADAVQKAVLAKQESNTRKNGG